MLKIGNQQFKLLEKLSNAVAVSGDEGAVRKIVLEEVEPLADVVKIDALGSVLVTKKGTQRNRLRVMLAAHMDEIGFMITYDDGKGIFRFSVVGGIDPRQLAGKPVWVGTEKVPGVIGAKPIHLTTAGERKKTIPVKSLRIDVGAKNAGKVKVGDRATFATEYQRLSPSIRAKALDDRLGVTTLIELLKNAPPNIDLLAAFTVQEEVGLRGANVAAFAFDPDLALALDCTPANDLPSWDGEENTLYNTRLDHGPALYIADRATLSDPRLIRHLSRQLKLRGYLIKSGSQVAEVRMPAPFINREQESPAFQFRFPDVICTPRPPWCGSMIGRIRSTCCMRVFLISNQISLAKIDKTQP